MSSNRVFFPQQALDQWLEQGRVSLVDDELTITPAGRRFRLSSALHFTAEVGGVPDELGLVGKVKSLEQLKALNGEHYADSVVLGDNAYQVVEGFLGEPVPAPATRKPSGSRVPKIEDDDSALLLRLSTPCE
jgi:hypothetical protein